MPYFPTIDEIPAYKDMTEDFRGYNHNLRIDPGEFYDMKNMSSDNYPVLSVRQKRGVYLTGSNIAGIIAKDTLCHVDGSYFVMDGYRIDMGLSAEPKTLVSMGAYVIILPDKKYINTMDTTDRGSIEASFTSAADVTFTLCTINGEEYQNIIVSADEPADPANMELWMDTSTTPHTLKQYSATSSMWVPVASTYVRIASPGIGVGFEQYDGVEISGVVPDALKDLNAATVIWERGDDYIVVTGILDAVVTQTPSDGAVTVKREMPNLDFVTESENRLWGCRYGVAKNGEVVNEIYASKQGSFKNWNCFMGLATDSYTVSCGTDGQFTGAITHLGHPLFFKDNSIHKIYGDYPANYSVQTTTARGVQKGCSKSLAIVNELLYYKSRSGVCVYDGSLPVEISNAFGMEQYSDAVAGGKGNKYYVSMSGANGHHLFVYDTAKSMWHHEDDFHADYFCDCRENLYAVEHGTNKIIAMLGGGEQEGKIDWMVETGDIGLSDSEQKYISRVTMRMQLELGGVAEVFVRYDHQKNWERLATIRGTTLHSFSFPVRPRRCDHLRLKISGTGDARIYSITKTIEGGGELTHGR